MSIIISFLLSLFGVFIATIIVVGGISFTMMKTQVLGFAVGWIVGWFVMAFVCLESAVTSHPKQSLDVLWIIAKIIMAGWLALKGRGYYKKSYPKDQEIPGDPPTNGYLSVRGRIPEKIKEDELYGPGIYFVPSWWPFLAIFVLIPLARYNLDSPFLNYSTKSLIGKNGDIVESANVTKNGSTAGKIGTIISGAWSIVYSADSRNVKLFLKNERQKGIDNQLKDIIPKVLKDALAKITWEDAVQGHEDACKQTFKVLTGIEEIPSQADLNKGIRDILSLGILIHSFYLKEIVSPLDKTMQKVEEQRIEREGQMQIVLGLQTQLETLAGKGSTMSIQDAIDTILLITEDGVSKIIHDFRGLQPQGNALDADALINLLEAINIPLDEEKMAMIRKKFPAVQSQVGGLGGGMNTAGLIAFLTSLGIPLPTQGQTSGQNQKQTAGGGGNQQGSNTQGEKKSPTITKEEARKRRIENL